MLGGNQMLVAGGLLIALCGAFAWLRSPASSAHVAGNVNPRDPEQGAANQARRASVADELVAKTGDEPSATPQQSARLLADGIRARLRAEAKQHAAIQPHADPHPAAAAAERAPAMPAPVGSGNQRDAPLGRYVRDIVRRDFFPVAGSCYENALHAQPDAGGSITLNVTVVGDEAVGGVVDLVEVGNDSTLTDSEFVTCLRESMYALSFAAPPQGEHRVTFSYPFVFSPDDAPDH